MTKLNKLFYSLALLSFSLLSFSGCDSPILTATSQEEFFEKEAEKSQSSKTSSAHRLEPQEESETQENEFAATEENCPLVFETEELCIEYAWKEVPQPSARRDQADQELTLIFRDRITGELSDPERALRVKLVMSCCGFTIPGEVVRTEMGVYRVSEIYFSLGHWQLKIQSLEAPADPGDEASVVDEAILIYEF